MTDKIAIPPHEKIYLTMAEAAALCGLSRTTLRPFVDRGEIPSTWFGAKRAIYRPGLDAWAARRAGVEPSGDQKGHAHRGK